jgi:lysophospholipase L1-like esterase
VAACLGTAVALAGGEAAARLVPKRPVKSEFELYAPHHHIGYRIVPYAPSMRFRGPHNSLGLRGRDLTPAPRPEWIRIACVGGSTTYGTQNEEAECWPRQLEGILRRQYAKTEVINAGVPAYNSADCLQLTRGVVLPLKPHLVIFYLGPNDVIPRYHAGYRADYAHHRRTWEAPRAWGASSPSALIRWIGNAWTPVPDGLVLVSLTSHKAPGGHALEQSTFGVSDASAFARNVRTLVATTQGSGARVLLLTHGCDPRRLGVDFGLRERFYERGLREHADAVRSVAAATGTPIADLARDFDSQDAFADATHHNDLGARRMASDVAVAIRRNTLMRPRTRCRPIDRGSP